MTPSPAMTAPTLDVQDLKTHFYTSAGVVQAVDGITYDVAPGETVWLHDGLGHDDEAIEYLRQSVDIDPRSAPIRTRAVCS